MKEYPRSNYFKVKDTGRIPCLGRTLDLKVTTDFDDPDAVAIFSETEHGVWPYKNAEGEEIPDFAYRPVGPPRAGTSSHPNGSRPRKNVLPDRLRHRHQRRRRTDRHQPVQHLRNGKKKFNADISAAEY